MHAFGIPNRKFLREKSAADVQAHELEADSHTIFSHADHPLVSVIRL